MCDRGRFVMASTVQSTPESGPQMIALSFIFPWLTLKFVTVK